jgi:hypothetical protein
VKQALIIFISIGGCRRPAGAHSGSQRCRGHDLLGAPWQVHTRTRLPSPLRWPRRHSLGCHCHHSILGNGPRERGAFTCLTCLALARRLWWCFLFRYHLCTTALLHCLGVQVDGADETMLLIEATVNAAELVRVAQARAFEKRGRSMVASDVMNALHEAVEECWPVAR